MAAITRIGFLGLGVMGAPMALRLADKFPLTVWNRSPAKYPLLREAGAQIAKSPTDVAKQSEVLFTMLFNEEAIDSIWSDEFSAALRGKTLINTSSVSVEYSHELAQRVLEAGGDFVEMPVSGSKTPAEQGMLVGMLAGDAAVAERVKSIVEPITVSTTYCGSIGSALKTKYATNLYLIALATGLAEAMNLAKAQGLDLGAFGQVLEAGPMSSIYMKAKIDKILKEDWSAHTTVKDCYNSTQLIEEAARRADAKVPLLEHCAQAYKQAIDDGHGEEDLIAVVKAADSVEKVVGIEHR